MECARKGRKTLAFSQTQNLAFVCGGQGWCTKSEHCEISTIANHRNIGNCVPITVLCSDFRGDLASRASIPSKSRALTLTRLSDGGYTQLRYSWHSSLLTATHLSRIRPGIRLCHLPLACFVPLLLPPCRASNAASLSAAAAAFARATASLALPPPLALRPPLALTAHRPLVVRRRHSSARGRPRAPRWLVQR